jgi:hypothetical protein
VEKDLRPVCGCEGLAISGLLPRKKSPGLNYVHFPGRNEGRQPDFDGISKGFVSLASAGHQVIYAFKFDENNPL